MYGNPVHFCTFNGFHPLFIQTGFSTSCCHLTFYLMISVQLCSHAMFPTCFLLHLLLFMICFITNLYGACSTSLFILRASRCKRVFFKENNTTDVRGLRGLKMIKYKIISWLNSQPDLFSCTECPLTNLSVCCILLLFKWCFLHCCTNHLTFVFSFALLLLFSNLGCSSRSENIKQCKTKPGSALHAPVSFNSYRTDQSIASAWNRHCFH